MSIEISGYFSLNQKFLSTSDPFIFHSWKQTYNLVLIGPSCNDWIQQTPKKNDFVQKILYQNPWQQCYEAQLFQPLACFFFISLFVVSRTQCN